MKNGQITPQTALRGAVRMFPSRAAFARLVGKSKGRITQLLSDPFSECPAEWVLPIERETGVKRSLLRPDLYPPEELNGA